MSAESVQQERDDPPAYEEVQDTVSGDESLKM